MAQDIFVVKTMGDALRNTGYKNIECAMSEIIDNSIQADAKNVFCCNFRRIQSKYWP